jgi:GT2 family glycosyltransferase
VEPEEQPSPPQPVVAVVVTHDAPGERLDEVLRALASQDYPNLDVLVVDTGTIDPTERVHAVVPAATVHRVRGDPGFGVAANTVLDIVAGAGFYVFCHDDAAPEPQAVSALVATAERWHADIVGPKLVRWDDRRRFTQFGLTVDKVGESLPYVLHGELDQGQHDGLRDVFAVPGAFTLVRASRFAEVGGFDEEITFLGDDLSLSWRARVAGARVLVTSAARVRHAEAGAVRADGVPPARLAARHRVRVLLTSYTALSLLWIVPQALALTLVEAAGALVTARPGRAVAALGAWPWNLWHLRSLLAARRHVASFRTVADREVRRYQVQGLVGPRLTLLRVGGDGRAGDAGHGASRQRAAAVPVRGHMDVDPAAWTPAALAVAACVAAVVAFGSRHLLTRGVPVVGELVPPGGSAGDLLGAWWGGWRPVGLGAEGATPALTGVLGLLGTVLGGHVGLARTALVVGLVPLGILGAHRLLAPTGSKRAQVAAAVAYAAVPLPYDALSAGRWTALGAYAAVPWMLGRLARASGTAPFGSQPVGATGLGRTQAPEAPTGDDAPAARGRPRHRLGSHVVVTGVVTALAGVVVPQAPALLVLMGAALVVGSLLAGQVRGTVRLVVATLGGAAVAALLLLPSTVDVVSSPGGVDAWLGTDRVPDGLAAVDLLALRTGPAALAGVAFALLAAAAVPLLVGRRWRLAWAIRAWTLAVAVWGVAWAHEQAWLSVRLPGGGVLLAPAAAGLALAVGIGMAAVEHDVRGRSWRLGFRRLVVAAGVLALAASPASAFVAALDGWWGMPRDDFATLMGFVDDAAAAGPSRTLWVGEPALVPGGDGWALDDQLSYTASTGRAVPAVADLWPATSGDGSRRLGDALSVAVDGETTRLGALLTPMGVQYVAVPLRLAPSDETPRSPAAAQATDEVVAALAEQLDLERLGVDRSLVLYRNTAFAPVPPGAPGAVDLEGPSGGSAGARVLLVAQAGLWLVVVAVALRMRFGAESPTGPARPASRPSARRARGRPGAAARPRPATAGAAGSGDPLESTVDDSTPAAGTPGERRVPAGGPGSGGASEPGERRVPAGRVPPTP